MRLPALAVALAVLLPSFVMGQSVDESAAKSNDESVAQNNGDAGAPPSLDELGFPKEQVQGSDQDQALLDKRSRMLKIHQVLGLINIGPMLATLYSAPDKNASHASINLHATLGVTTLTLYAATAYFAIMAPKPAGTVDKGPIKVHKALAWIHGIGFAVTPILGVMAYDQRNNGEKVHGLASYHGTAATISALAYGGAIASVSIKF